MRLLEDLARRLLHKAKQDGYSARVLAADPEASDEAVGFHAQQAIEKTLKAVLASRGVPYKRTHNLVQIVAELREAGVAFPLELEDSFELGPFAVALRYENLTEEEDEPLDRAWALNSVERVWEWAASALKDTPLA